MYIIYYPNLAHVQECCGNCYHMRWGHLSAEFSFFPHQTRGTCKHPYTNPAVLSPMKHLMLLWCLCIISSHCISVATYLNCVIKHIGSLSVGSYHDLVYDTCYLRLKNNASYVVYALADLFVSELCDGLIAAYPVLTILTSTICLVTTSSRCVGKCRWGHGAVHEHLWIHSVRALQ